MDYQLFADILWYLGHIITGLAIVINHYYYYIAVVTVFIGQLMTIISRPIGRIRY